MTNDTYVEDQGNEVVEDTNANLEGRNDVMTDAILPQVQATQEIEDTHVTLTLINPDGQQQSSSVSSGFVSNMLNPNQDTGVDDIFEQHAEATSLIDTPVTAIVEPSFTAPTNRPPIPNPLEAVDVVVQLKYDKIREESNTANQQFLDSIEEGMKKIIKEQVKKEVSKITPKIEKLVIDQLESYEVLVRSQRKPTRRHSKASSTRTELMRMKRQKFCLENTYGNTVNNKKDLETGQMMIKNPLLEQTGGLKEEEKRRANIFLNWFQQPTRLPSPDHAWNKSVPAVHETVQPWLSNLARRQDPRESFDELTDNTFDFSAFVMNRYNFYAFRPTRESTRDVYSKRRIIAVTKVEISNGKLQHLDWITVRRDDDVLYKFKEGDFHRLRIQDIEDMLLLLVQGKVTNLNVEERIAFNIQSEKTRRLYTILDQEDHPTENKDKKNRLMRIDELHKFSDGTLDDVRIALNDRLKGIRMEYLPQTFWSQRDKANARAMIQAIDKRLKTRRIMRSLERFVGGRPYGGDLRLLQRTI
ncbi:hypothetical protein Tco_0694243 [Tanacetum coccineum]